jgi:hypothetical protein
MVILRSIVWYPNWGSHKEPHYLPLKKPKIGEPKNIHVLSWSTIVICKIKRWEQEGCIQKSRFPAGKLKTED